MAEKTSHQKTQLAQLSTSVWNVPTMETLPGSEISTDSRDSCCSSSNVGSLAEMSDNSSEIHMRGQQLSFGIDDSHTKADSDKTKDQNQACSGQDCNLAFSRRNSICAGRAASILPTDKHCTTANVPCTFSQTLAEDRVSDIVQQPASCKSISEVVSQSFIVAKSFLVAPSVQEKTVQWLRFLFFATLVLFVFQLLLGWMARAVTLVADSGHTATDAVGYGLNALAEWFKLRSTRSSRNVVSSNELPSAAFQDTLGSLFSLVLLGIAILFTVVEATDRLQTPSGVHVESIGPALLVFAIVSTGMNLSLLLLYWHWHKEAPLVQQAQGEGRTELEDPAVVAFDNYIKDLDFCPLCTNPADGFAGNAITPAIAENIGGESRDENERETGVSNSSESLGSASNREDSLDATSPEESFNYLQTLHRWVHPGCDCTGLDAALGRQYERKQNEEVKANDLVELERGWMTPEAANVSKLDENLNLFSALLHLITDLLRSILILGASIVIHFVGCQNAEYIDAICALLVGFLIFLGSLTLLVKLCGRVCQHRCMERDRSTIVATRVRSEGSQSAFMERAAPLL